MRATEQSLDQKRSITRHVHTVVNRQRCTRPLAPPQQDLRSPTSASPQVAPHIPPARCVPRDHHRDPLPLFVASRPLPHCTALPLCNLGAPTSLWHVEGLRGFIPIQNAPRIVDDLRWRGKRKEREAKSAHSWRVRVLKAHSKGCLLYTSPSPRD